jgi:hypothetical protein
MFEQFARDGNVRLGPMPYAKANSSRRDLYRYRLFLINAVEEDPDDTFARELYDAARNVTMRIEGAGNRCFIVLELNPIVAAMRNPEATSEARSDRRRAVRRRRKQRQTSGEPYFRPQGKP